jgi:succinate dehydrogenase / fumarate reductase cytochrome b subunit
MTLHGLKATVENVRRYRGGAGQWAWVFHRLSGLGVLLFLMLHIIDTSTVYFAPSAYDFFVRLYKNPLFGLSEIGLAAALIYHSVNGLKLVVLDFWPRLWPWHDRAQLAVWVLFGLLFVPTGGIMLYRIIQHNTQIALR